MRISGPSKLKRTPTDTSDAIMLTFNAKWQGPLLAGEVEVVFRKQGPRGFVPTLMYPYVAAPISAIVARIPIISYASVSAERAIELANRGSIDKDELRDYANGLDSLLVIELGPVAVAKYPITCSYMSEHFNFWPSSTYIPISATGMQRLDKLGQFENINK